MSYAKRFFPHFWISTTSPPALASTALAAVAAASTPSSPNAGSRIKITSYDRTLLTSLVCSGFSASPMASLRRVRRGPRARVVSVHGRPRSLQDQAAHRLGGSRHRLSENRRLLRRDIGEDPTRGVLTGLRPADADPDAREIRGAQRLLDGADAPVPARPRRRHDPQASDGKVEIVVHDDQSRRRKAKAREPPGHGRAAPVHE